MRSQGRVFPATPRSLWHIANRLRSADIAEVAAFSGRSPVQAVFTSALKSDYTKVIWCGNRPVAAFGVGRATLCSPYGIPWLLGTRDVERLSIAILRSSRQYIKQMVNEYGRLENFVDERNTVAIRWLDICGFTFDGKAVPRGVEKKPFIHFWMEK